MAETGIAPHANAPSARLHGDKRFAEVLGSRMAYVDLDGAPAAAAPVLFLHGNPTSSFLWRNVLPAVAPRNRCIAPDLIGMGDSDKLSGDDPERYSFFGHRRYLDALLDRLLPAGPLVLVLHDWGSALGFDWANRHRERVLGICYMEAIVRPLIWDEWPEAARRVFQGFRSPAGEEMVLQKNSFVERVLPASMLRSLDATELAEYRRPFASAGEDRRPTLTWPRQIPLDGQPPAVVAVVQAYADWLAGAALPKLFINADPGSILVGAQRDFARTFPNQTEVTVAGSHFIQEDSPAEIGAAIAQFVLQFGGV